MRILAVDYGDARTGLAVCDREELLASPLEVAPSGDRERLTARVAAVAAENGVGLIVVGNPINMNGTLGPRSELCAGFAGELAAATGLPVTLWDERGTTVSAARYLNLTDTRGKKRKRVIDAVAAVIILDSFMAWRKNNPGAVAPQVAPISGGHGKAGDEEDGQG